MRGEVKRFKKVSKLEAYRSDGSPKTSSSSLLPPLLTLSLSLSLSLSTSSSCSLSFKKRETWQNETRNDSITWQDFKSSNAKRIFSRSRARARGLDRDGGSVRRYSKLCNAIATAQSDINFNGPERRHL